MIVRGELTELRPLYYLESIEILGIGSLLKGGFPNPADDFFRDAINLGDILIQNPDSTYYGYAWSDSMQPLIWEGMIVLVDISLADSIRNGNYIVAELDGELCMKRFWKENEIITLHSENEHYPPIVIREGMSFRVLGKITKTIQSL